MRRSSRGFGVRPGPGAQGTRCCRKTSARGGGTVSGGGVLCGAGVLSREGHRVGIHTDGDCDESGRGTNHGWTARVIVEASPYLQATDLRER
jgi:hypothetical protein